MADKNLMDFIFLCSCGDATDNYDVVFSGPCTVGQLVDFVMIRSKKTGERGDIWITTEYGEDVYILSYKNGKRDRPLRWIKNYDENILDEHKDKNIAKIIANGGYSCMSYYARIEQTKTEGGVSDG